MAYKNYYKCSVDDCIRARHAKKLCTLHYNRLPDVRDRISLLKKIRYHNGTKMYYRRYEKTETGFLMRSYRNMLSRIRGVQKKKAHLYLGKEILPREDFYAWALSSENFYTIFSEWKKSNYDRKLTPSVNRIDSSLGYLIKNMEWITHSENSTFGNISRYSKKHD